MTQSKAISEIRTRTGLSERSATEKVAAMPKIEDGARWKVNSYSVEIAIAEINAPPVTRKVKSIKPLSPKMVARIRLVGMPLRNRA